MQESLFFGDVAMLVLVFLLVIMVPVRANAVEVETLQHDPFGSVEIFRSDSSEKGVVVFVSGAEGWTGALTALAQAVAELDYLVVGIDLRAWRLTPGHPPNECLQLDRELERLARDMALRYRLPQQSPPILIGDGAGAAAVYVALSAAAPGAVHAGLSLDFCPAAELAEHLCPGPGLQRAAGQPAASALMLQPVSRVPTSWFVLQAQATRTCPTAADFVARIEGAKVIQVSATTPKGDVASAFLPSLKLLLEWLDPRIEHQLQADLSVDNVPLTPTLSTVPEAAGEPRFALMISGDGGWAAFDRGVADVLRQRGISTIGWDALSYFWQAKNPQAAGADLERVLQHYLVAWGKEQVLLIGYSFGANVLPFMVSYLSADLRQRVSQVVLIAPTPRATFEFHLRDWLGGSRQDGLETRAGVASIPWANRLCLYGDQEEDSACPLVEKLGVSVQALPGTHHLGDDYVRIVDHMLAESKAANVPQTLSFQ